MYLPVQPGLILVVTRFAPRRVESQYGIRDLEELQERLTGVAKELRLALIAEIDGGQGDLLLIHLTGDRAWVAHFESHQGGDSYAFDPTHPRSTVEGVAFRLSNGQEDVVHRHWTIGRTEALQALEYFTLSGQRSPLLAWDETIELL
jgi:hypothetical protein